MQLQDLVREKESGLRQALRTAGMLDSSYWASWLLHHTLMKLVTAVFTLIAGPPGPCCRMYPKLQPCRIRMQAADPPRPPSPPRSPPLQATPSSWTCS